MCVPIKIELGVWPKAVVISKRKRQRKLKEKKVILVRLCVIAVAHAGKRERLIKVE